MKASFRRLLAPTFLSVLVVSGQLAAQNPTKPKKVLTPEQQEIQAKFKSYLAQRKVLQKQAAQTFDAESARGKAGDCKNVNNTRDSEICLQEESEITEKNYSTFTEAIRALLSLAPPESGRSPVLGPTGTPLDAAALTQEFDNLQTAWAQYRKIATATAYDQYKGGTAAPVFSVETDQKLLRSHMRELNFIYDGLLHR